MKMDPADLDHCRDAIRHGSLSFHAASKLLPSKVRDPALALYAFCRVADDDIDLTRDKARALARLEERLDKAYQGKPENAPTDRAFTAMIEAFDMPRALPEALLEGFAWDVEERRYQTLKDVVAYSARVASAVGVMMCVLMRVRDRDALARAADLGVAMQLTNIARDVGEDAMEGRIYLPLEWLETSGIEPETLIRDPRPTKAIRIMVKTLLMRAERLYQRSEAGITALPMSCRPGIFAARYIYAGIGGRLRQAGHDPISERARTSSAQKIRLLGKSFLRGATTAVMPQSPVIFAPPLSEVAFLVDAAAEPKSDHWSDALTEAFSQLALTDRKRHAQTNELSRQ